MMLKIIGSIIVLISCSLTGYKYSLKYSRRPQELRVLQGLFQLFENEIGFMSSVLKDAFLKIYTCTESKSAIFFKACVEELDKEEGLNAREAWVKGVEKNIKNTSLDNEDKEILISFGKMLGSSDLDGQIKNIRLTIKKLELQEDKAEELRRRNEKMYKHLGVLCGLAIVIILF